MEITKSLLNDIEIAPDWFHSAISNQARVEVIEQPLGKVKYQVWDRNNSDIVLLIHGTGAHKKWLSLIHI